MNEFLRLALLGSPQVSMGSRPLTGFTTNKAQALLFYLAVTGTSQPAPHSREHLVTLLWGEMSNVKARQNLRAVLPELRRLVGPYLRVERQTISFDTTNAFWLDVEVFQRELARGTSPGNMASRQAAIDLYRGEFLSGFYVHNAPAFEDWIVEQRQKYHILMVNALFALVNERIERLEFEAALASNQALLLLEPWSEPAHRQQMLILARRGERSAALAQFESCRRILAAEFGVEPLPETIALYEQIRTGEIGVPEGGLPAIELERQSGMYDRELSQPSVQNPLILVNEQDLPLQTELFGRGQELERLHRWIAENDSRLVGIFGIGGQGKSTLAASLTRRLAESVPPGGRFRRIIWTSLLNAPPLAEVLQEWLYILSDQIVTGQPASLDTQLSQLLRYLRDRPALLILDNLESILQHDGSGIYRPGYEGYGRLIRLLVETTHRGCLLLTSREWPRDLANMDEQTPTFHFLSLPGLPTEAGREMLSTRGVRGDNAALEALAEHYSGNPMALKLASETVSQLFGGNIAAFLRADSRIFDDIRDILDQQFARLTPLERELMVWLAIVREPVTYPELRDLLAQPPPPRRVLETIRSLWRRSLLETYGDRFGLQNVVLEYTTEWLVDSLCAEIMDDPEGGREARWMLRPIDLAGRSFLNTYALILAQAKEYVRLSQTRLLLQPVAEQLVAQLGMRGAEQRLQGLLVRLRDTPPGPGYAGANLLHLLIQLGVDLREYDFSQLYFRQLYLRGVSLPQTDFATAEVVDSVFTEPFGLIYAVAFSPDGQYVAAGTTEGAVYIWHTADQKLVQVIQAHRHAIRELIFSESTSAEGDRHLVLASASDDRRVGLWVLDTQGSVLGKVHLVHEQQEMLVAVGLHPDGQRVTTVDVGGHVFVWEVDKGQNPQLVHHFATAFSRIRLVAFSQDGDTVAIGHRDGTVRLWQAASGEASLQLAGTTGLIFTLVLSQDGRMLVTGGREGHLSLWRLPTGELHQVVETRAGAIRSLAISPDGKFLASGHEDLAIRLWSIDAQGHLHLQRTLQGHTQRIWSISFSPTPAAQPEVRPENVDWGGIRHETRQLLVSGSSDQTVRVWDVETGYTLYMLRGQARVLAAHTIRQLPPKQVEYQSGTPRAPEWVLAAAGYDQLIHLWQGHGNRVDSTHRVLEGATGPLYAVAISPDGRSVVAGGYDRAIYLWDRASGQLRQTYHGHTGSIYTLGFHPGGKLLVSGSGDGTMRLWMVAEMDGGQEIAVDVAMFSQPVAVLQADQDVVHDLAFSPDGRILARGGSDRSLRLWDISQSHYPEMEEARRLLQDESEEDIFAVAFSPDGSKVACSGNHSIHIVGVANGRVPLILRQHTAWIYSVAFSPDGEILASSGADCTVCLWKVATGALLAVLRGHRETVYKVGFTPDGTTVVSSSFDGSLKFWDTQTGECVNTLRVDGPYAGMNITDIKGITRAQTAALKALGAVERPV